MARAPATTPRRRADEPAAAVELTLLSRVAYRDQEITGPRLRGLLALLAGDLRTGCSTARLVEGLWPDELPEHPSKALQVARLPRPGAARRRRHRQHPHRLPPRPRPRTRSTPRPSCAAPRRAPVVPGPATTRRRLRTPRPGSRCGRGPRAATPAWTTRWPRCARNGRRPTGRWPGPGRWRCRGWAATPRRSTSWPGWSASVHGTRRCWPSCCAARRRRLGPAAALDRYEAYRRSLRDELGTDPGAALQAVHQQLLQGTAPVVRHGVAYEPNPLLGRDDDIAAVADLLRSVRVTSIVGPGGLGKTRLAQVVSRQAEQRIVHFVPLAGVAADDDVAGEVASALGAGGPDAPRQPARRPHRRRRRHRGHPRSRPGAAGAGQLRARRARRRRAGAARWCR